MPVIKLQMLIISVDLLGLGGKKLSKENALDTASLLSNLDYKELENKELSKWKRWSIE